MTSEAQKIARIMAENDSVESLVTTVDPEMYGLVFQISSHLLYTSRLAIQAQGELLNNSPSSTGIADAAATANVNDYNKEKEKEKQEEEEAEAETIEDMINSILENDGVKHSPSNARRFSPLDAQRFDPQLRASRTPSAFHDTIPPVTPLQTSNWKSWMGGLSMRRNQQKPKQGASKPTAGIAERPVGLGLDPYFSRTKSQSRTVLGSWNGEKAELSAQQTNGSKRSPFSNLLGTAPKVSSPSTATPYVFASESCQMSSNYL